MPDHTCTIDGCENVHVARGWCSGHYERWKHHDDPRRGAPVRQRPRAMSDCDIPGCIRLKRYTTLGFCRTHYTRWKRFGNPLAGDPIADRGLPDHDRLRNSVEIDPETGCWKWQLGRRSDGYGQVKVGGRTLGAHRWSYQIHRGEIPGGMTIHHTCFTPSCVNPQHLECVTRAENSRNRESHCPTCTCMEGHD